MRFASRKRLLMPAISLYLVVSVSVILDWGRLSSPHLTPQGISTILLDSHALTAKMHWKFLLSANVFLIGTVTCALSHYQSYPLPTHLPYKHLSDRSSIYCLIRTIRHVPTYYVLPLPTLWIFGIVNKMLAVPNLSRGLIAAIRK